MAFRLKPCVAKMDTSHGEDDSDRFPRNVSVDSIASIIFPWKTVRQRLIIHSQSGREANPLAFFLCMGAVMLLCTGIGICIATLWAVIYRMPYTYLTNGIMPIEINIFSLCAGILSIPCFWIAWTTHDNLKNYVFLPLLMVLIGFCLIMLIISTSMGLVYKSRMNFDTTTKPPQFLPNQYKKLITETMLASMSSYKNSSKYRSAWDQVQQRLECCGTNSFLDWRNIKQEMPSSCYSKLNPKADEIYQKGCLDLVAFDLFWETCLISGLSFIVFFLQLYSLIIASYMYIKGLIQKRNVPVVLQVSNFDVTMLTEE